MCRILLVWVAAFLIAGGLIPQSSRGQDPVEILEHYRLLPRVSVLHQSGGIAGVSQRYRLTGEYDFLHGLRPLSPASFENAEIWGSLISDLPTPAVVIDVDEILNIDGLEGRLLPSHGPLDFYEFRGKTGDGSSIHAHAAVLGRWMYMRGFTEPPPDSADFFEYRFQTLARRGPSADMNDDGVVNAADFVAMRDVDGIGRNVRSDLTIGAGLSDWRQQFGEATPDLTAMDTALSSALASFASVTSVPEPASVSLAFAGALLIAALPRRRHEYPLGGMFPRLQGRL
jgi:hypothetical protein